jgi:hypothetical protein
MFRQQVLIAENLQIQIIVKIHSALGLEERIYFTFLSQPIVYNITAVPAEENRQSSFFIEHMLTLLSV